MSLSDITVRTEIMSDYNVIIIGGRPAGASLAIRLGQQGIKTLLVDKATFPSLPAVPSSPILYPHHLDMLKDLGISESEALHADGRMESFVVSFIGHFHAAIPVSAAEANYDYAYGADRTKFDTAIWDKAATYESVTARSGFSVTGVLKENGKVIGIKGQSGRGSEETLTADLVVGADGRFSGAALDFEAATLEEHNEQISSSWQAEWENVADGYVPRSGTMYNTGKGFAVIVIPIDTRKYIIGTYLRPEHHKSDMRVEESYLEALQNIPEVWARLKDAKRVTPVVGVKGIKNGMRQPFGDGWALVGDAFHYKDPLDGQGIYDAFLESKILAEAIQQWHSGSLTWDQAGQQYKDQAIAATHPMMLQTVNRVKQELFTDPPPFIIKTMIRWLMNDPAYQRDFFRLLTRQSDPARWQTPGVMGRAIRQGIMNDLFGRKSPKPAVAPKPIG